MLKRIFKKIKKEILKPKNLALLKTSKIGSYQGYKNHVEKHREKNLANLLFGKNLIPDTQTEFTFNGYCYVCHTSVDFLVDFKYSDRVNGILSPNWRERLVCPTCNLNNRMRATVHIFDKECQPNQNSKIYITEQTTVLYEYFKRTFSHVVGSEYLGNLVNYGSLNEQGIRNENLTQLSFDNNEFDYILSFDVLEHIPNYKKALAECCRCLKPGGMLYFSVPFVKTNEKNLVRAYLSDTGEVIHLLPPEYHGDPLSSEGCLCFYHFGWEILDELNALGFKNSVALLYWSSRFGYLGDEQIIFMATKNS